jgi:D-mannonate dehydratase
MALLSDVYGDDFAKEMKEKKYDCLEQKKSVQSTPILTPEEIEENNKRSEKLRDEIIESFNNKITIGNFTIKTMCYQTYPCQHYCNGELMYSTNIFKLIKNSNIDLDNLTNKQKQFITHLQYKH